jgi:hypothetical protein
MQHQIFFILLLGLLRRLSAQIGLCVCLCCDIGSLRRIFAMLCPRIVLALLPRIAPRSLRLLRKLLRNVVNSNSLILNLMKILFVFNHIYLVFNLACKILFFVLQLQIDAFLHTQKPRIAHLDLLAEESTCRI